MKCWAVWHLVVAISLLARVETSLSKSNLNLSGGDILVPTSCVEQLVHGLSYLVGGQAATESWRRILIKIRGRGQAGSNLSKLKVGETCNFGVVRLLLADANSQEWDLVFERLTARTRASTVCIDVELAVEALLVAVVVDDDPEDVPVPRAPCLTVVPCAPEQSSGTSTDIALVLVELRDHKKQINKFKRHLKQVSNTVDGLRLVSRRATCNFSKSWPGRAT